ncbi:MAG: bifunctional diguanylate cyclase/phosphodiesterase [Pseudomonadota bacterium]
MELRERDGVPESGRPEDIERQGLRDATRENEENRWRRERLMFIALGAAVMLFQAAQFLVAWRFGAAAPTADAGEGAAPAAALLTASAGVVALALIVTGAILAELFIPARQAYRKTMLALADARAELQYIALYDKVTGLPHRQCLEIQLEALLMDREREGESIGIVVLELGGLDKLDEQFGFATSETALQGIAHRLRDDAGPTDILGRLDGPRFALIIGDVMDEEEVVTVAARQCDLAAEPVFIDGHACRPAVRAGALMATVGEGGSQALLMDACLAVGRGDSGRSGNLVTLYTPEIRRAVSGQFELATRLRKALEDNHIQPFFQPQVTVDTGRIVGVEALVRWIDPDRGPQSPAAFLPVAMEHGLMTQIDDVMRRKSLRAVRDCRDAGLDLGHIGLNLTVDQLCEPGFTDRLRFDAESVGLGPEDIAIEILESIMVDDGSDDVVETVAGLAEAGYYIELDDFGTGHSGLSTLRDLVVHRVKIDRSFVRFVDQKADLARFTAALIRLAQNMKIDVLAEGIEREEELAWLAAAGCDAIQGYMIAKPMPVDEVLPWAKKTGRFVEGTGAVDPKTAVTG